jgi:hypothetical protein
MTAEHTKTPWHLVPVKANNTTATMDTADWYNIYAANAYVCQVKRDGHPGIQRADAAFVVLAVNCHDELVAACKEMVAEFDESNRRYCELNPGTIGYPDSVGVGLARAAIAKATA